MSNFVCKRKMLGLLDGCDFEVVESESDVLTIIELCQKCGRKRRKNIHNILFVSNSFYDVNTKNGIVEVKQT